MCGLAYSPTGFPLSCCRQPLKVEADIAGTAGLCLSCDENAFGLLIEKTDAVIPYIDTRKNTNPFEVRFSNR